MRPFVGDYAPLDVVPQRHPSFVDGGSCLATSLDAKQGESQRQILHYFLSGTKRSFLEGVPGPRRVGGQGGVKGRRG